MPEDKEAPKLQSPKGLEEVQSELSYMKALDGFVLVLSQQGDIVYCSENIAEHLGVSQVRLLFCFKLCAVLIADIYFFIVSTRLIIYLFSNSFTIFNKIKY